jgi:hypothetical protein
VPEDIELAGDEETFRIVVTYDTKGLFGTIKGEQEFVVAK